MKVVINTCYGGFSLSKVARDYIWDKHNRAIDKYPDQYPGEGNSVRSDPVLVDAVENLREEANGTFAELKVVEIPDDVKWHIEEYDGKEWVAEDHRKWS